MKLYFSPGSCGLASQIALREAEQRFDLNWMTATFSPKAQ